MSGPPDFCLWEIRSEDGGAEGVCYGVYECYGATGGQSPAHGGQNNGCFSSLAYVLLVPYSHANDHAAPLLRARWTDECAPDGRYSVVNSTLVVSLSTVLFTVAHV